MEIPTEEQAGVWGEFYFEILTLKCLSDIQWRSSRVLDIFKTQMREMCETYKFEFISTAWGKSIN